jgi:hypothetical protein
MRQTAITEVMREYFDENMNDITTETIGERLTDDHN